MRRVRAGCVEALCDGTVPGIEFHALFADLNHLNYFVSAQTLRPEDTSRRSFSGSWRKQHQSADPPLRP